MQLCWRHDYLTRYWTNTEYRENRKATKRAYGRKRLQVKRDIIAKALGGWKCVKCGNSDRDVLTFDHKNGGGEADRSQMGGQFPSINYYYMHPDNARERLQVLCANCNWLKNFIDPNEGTISKPADVLGKTRKGLIDLLGGPKCVSCGESDEIVLTIDHINGGGTADRKLRGGNKSMYRYYSTHPGEARVKLRVLCRNCNWKSHRATAGVRHLV